MSIQFLHLVDCPEYLPTIATWFHDEWGYQHTDLSLASRTAELSLRCQRDRLPITIVAVKDQEILGTYSLDLADMDTRRHLAPWLASVYVAPKFRSQGFGRLLVSDAMRLAKTLGITRWYLFTTDQAHWYATMGWRVMEQTIYCGKDTSVMDIDLS